MELRRNGSLSPGDRGCRFDDVEESLYCSPLLTTVSQPLYEQGRLAAETLLKMIRRGDGEEIREKIVVPAKAVFRESCGCFSEMTQAPGTGG